MSDRLPPVERRPGELTVRELGRWSWRQLTSMRTALVLLLLLALAAVPGSVVPQEGVDALRTSRWQEAHPELTPIYDRLGLFAVYESAWFSAIYLLLMVSLVGCIIPRSLVYWRAVRARPASAPRHLTRMPDHASYTSSDAGEDVLVRATQVLRAQRYRVDTGDGTVAAERGYLREAGNLVFHVSVVVVLVGFALGGLFGYRGGVILVQGTGFANQLTQYDDFVPGRVFTPEQLDPFVFTVEDFDVEWLESGPRQGMAQGFSAAVSYREAPGSDEETYDLRVNHPLTIGDTDLFLIGHGYAPVVTIRDGQGDVAKSGPVVFLPQDQSLLSFGVVKAPDARPAQVALEGLLYPTFVNLEGQPVNVIGDDRNPLLSLLVHTGDLGMESGGSQSVYVLDKAGTEEVLGPDGRPLRLDLSIGETVELPDGLGSVTFEGLEPWTRIQISQTPGKEIALAGVVLALLGLLGSLFIRPRRVWVRVTPAADGAQGTLVEVAALDRSGGGDVAAVIDELVAELQQPRGSES